MTENEKPEKNNPDDPASSMRTSSNLKSLIQLAYIKEFKGNTELSKLTNNHLLLKHAFPESIKGSVFGYHASLKTMTESTSFQALYRVQKQMEFSKSLAAISQTPFYKVMDKFRTLTDLYKYPAMKKLYTPLNIKIAGGQMRRDLALLNSIAQEAGVLPRLISRDIASHDLLNKHYQSIFDNTWEKLSRLGDAELSFRNQVRAIEAINTLFAEDQNSFSYLTKNIIHSLEAQSGDEFEDVRKQIRDASKFSDYPSLFKIIIVFLLYHLLLEPLNEIKNNVIVNYIKQQCITDFLCESKKDQVKILTTNKPSELTYHDLNRIRVVRRDNVRLRVEPSMQAGVIEVLPINQPLVIINRENRMWLLVRTVLNGEEIEGWINRSYTKVLIK